jgi:hypothetical protein
MMTQTITVYYTPVDTGGSAPVVYHEAIVYDKGDRHSQAPDQELISEASLTRV